MTALTDRTPKDTYKDLLQVSNSNAGIDGTRRNISDGEGTNAPIKISTSAAEFTGIVDLSAATVGFAADQILFSQIDFSGDDTLTGNIDVAAAASIDFLSGATLTLVTGSTFTLPADFIPLSKVDLSGDDTIGGALEVASGASLTFLSGSTFTGSTGSTLDVSAATLNLRDAQIALPKLATIAESTILGRAASAGTGAVTALSVAQVKAILGITDPFTSAAITAPTLAAGDQTYSAAHGFGAAPFDAFAVLTCTTTDLGYSVGESVVLKGNSTKLSSSSVWSGFWVGFDATNVYGHQEGNLAIPNRSTGLISTITYASWSLYLCAVAA